MKIMALSDIHGDINLVRAKAEEAKKANVDFVLLCGDLTLNDSRTEGIIGPFKEKGLKVGIIPGNHEPTSTINFLTERYKLVNLHGYSYYLDRVGMFGCGSANIGLFQLSEEEIFNFLEKGHKSIEDKRKKIMVTHVHPSGSLIEKFTHFFPGSDAVRYAIEKFQPDLALCGHVHEAEGIEELIGKTRVINVGRKGKILEL
ncbi:metallophosphoesterase family protein [Candidatus Woesearchaeota archaeon]|nr:metallophosphoesterase family protein [Candidatus Woesearchaeota archaeon]